MKLYLDEHIKPLLADMLRVRGIDCLSTGEAGNLSQSDAEQLAFAASQRRAILTFDIPDYLRLASAWAQAGRTHSGIIVSDQLQPPELLRRLLRLAAQHGRDDLSNQVIWLHTFKDAPPPK